MIDKRGLHHKYYVARVDGTDTEEEGGKHYNCEYFVLDLTHDPDAVHALTSYIAAIRYKKPNLATDLRNKLKSMR